MAFVDGPCGWPLGKIPVDKPCGWYVCGTSARACGSVLSAHASWAHNTLMTQMDTTPSRAPDVVRICLPDDAATMALGRALAPVVRVGDAVLLRGDLGAGKTTLARALLRAMCDDPAMEVPSPSYTLVQTYDVPGKDVPGEGGQVAGGQAERGQGVEVSHFDLWRLDGPGALVELGWDDACEGIVLVEWPERLGALTPPHARHIDLVVRADGGRDAILRGWGADGRAVACVLGDDTKQAGEHA